MEAKGLAECKIICLRHVSLGWRHSIMAFGNVFMPLWYGLPVLW